MRASILTAGAALTALVAAPTAVGQVTVRVTNTVLVHTATGPGGMPGIAPGPLSNVQVAVVGKVVEVEPAEVEVAPYRGAPKDRMVKYKVANLKVEDRERRVLRVREGPLGLAGLQPALPAAVRAAGHRHLLRVDVIGVGDERC